MKKDSKFCIFFIIAAAVICFAAGGLVCFAVLRTADKGGKGIRQKQEQLKDRFTFQANSKVLEEITLDIDLTARGDVYSDRMDVLTSEMMSAQENEYFLVKLAEFFPQSEFHNGPSELYSIDRPTEYIALYLYGNYRDRQYALQWGDTVVKVDGVSLEYQKMQVMCGRDISRPKTTAAVVLRNVHNINEFTDYLKVFTKKGGTIIEYTLSCKEFALGLDESQLCFIETSGDELTVCTYDTALSVEAKREHEWEGKIPLFMRSIDDGMVFCMMAGVEDRDGFAYVAEILGDIYLDSEKSEFVIKDFYVRYYEDSKRAP